MTAIEWTKKRKITAFKAIHTASTQSTASHDAASTATDFQAAASTAVNFYGTTAASFDATVTASTRLHDRLDRHIAALDSNGLSDRAESNNKHESARLLALFSLAWTRRVLDQTSYILNDFCLSKENGVIGILVKLAGHMKELEDSYNCKGDFDAVIFNEDDFFNKTIVVPDRILYLLHDHVNWTELIDGFEHNLKRRYLPKHQSKWSKVYEDIFVKKTFIRTTPISEVINFYSRFWKSPDSFVQQHNSSTNHDRDFTTGEYSNAFNLSLKKKYETPCDEFLEPLGATDEVGFHASDVAMCESFGLSLVSDDESNKQLELLLDLLILPFTKHISQECVSNTYDMSTATDMGSNMGEESIRLF